MKNDVKKPRVKINNSLWNRQNGLRITVRTLHDGFSKGRMYSVEHARYLAKLLNEACDEIEREPGLCKEAFLELGRKLGFIEN